MGLATLLALTLSVFTRHINQRVGPNYYQIGREPRLIRRGELKDRSFSLSGVWAASCSPLSRTFGARLGSIGWLNYL